MDNDKKTLPQNCSAALVFADGKVFFGSGIGAVGTTVGEICFNTGITGYQEILTDLSYAGQIINFTFPHIGNVGTNDEDLESGSPAAKGLIIRDNITTPSNFRSTCHLNDWLKKKKITGICGVDTREITRYIRTHGPQNVAICYFEKKSGLKLKDLHKLAAEKPSLKGMELAKGVTCKEPYFWEETTWKLGSGFTDNKIAKHRVVAIDFGAKLNILRCLSSVGCKVKVVPSTATAEEILKYNPDGIFLSNGPGDPAATGKYALDVLKKLIDSGIPVFGICLGHQLLALALGCDTAKMHQGHRGSNHPVQDVATGKVEITSQNHGFVVTKESLSEDVEITHISLFDGTIEGIKSKTKPVFSVQHHPEASPGPQDSFYLFRRFVSLIEEHKGKKRA